MKEKKGWIPAIGSFWMVLGMMGCASQPKTESKAESKKEPIQMPSADISVPVTPGRGRGDRTFLMEVSPGVLLFSKRNWTVVFETQNADTAGSRKSLLQKHLDECQVQKVDDPVILVECIEPKGWKARRSSTGRPFTSRRQSKK